MFRPFQTHLASQDRKKTREELRKPIESFLDYSSTAPHIKTVRFFRTNIRKGIEGEFGHSELLLTKIKTCIGCLLQFGENTLAIYRTAENIVSCEYFVHISSYFTTNACFELCEFARACSLPKDPLTTAVWRISLAFLSFRPGSWDS